MKNTDLKEKCILSLILVIVMGFVLYYTYEDVPQKRYGGIIRLHVIANSDSKADQALKLKVRDKILQHMNGIKTNKTLSQSRAYLQDNLKQMEQIAKETIQQNGKSYTATADLGIRWIPEKTYGDTHFPAGNYEALNLTLGKGKGQNWWCVLFPPLCLIDDTAQEQTPDTLQNQALQDIPQEERIKLKSKLLEILQQPQPQEAGDRP